MLNLIPLLQKVCYDLIYYEGDEFRSTDYDTDGYVDVDILDHMYARRQNFHVGLAAMNYILSAVKRTIGQLVKATDLHRLKRMLDNMLGTLRMNNPSGPRSKYSNVGRFEHKLRILLKDAKAEVLKRMREANMSPRQRAPKIRKESMAKIHRKCDLVIGRIAIHPSDLLDPTNHPIVLGAHIKALSELKSRLYGAYCDQAQLYIQSPRRAKAAVGPSVPSDVCGDESLLAVIEHEYYPCLVPSCPKKEQAEAFASLASEAIENYVEYLTTKDMKSTHVRFVKIACGKFTKNAMCFISEECKEWVKAESRRLQQVFMDQINQATKIGNG